VLDDLPQVEPFALQLDPSVRYAGDVEQVVDQPRQMLELTAEQVARPRQHALEQLRLAQEIDAALHRGEGIAQLVREDRDEFVLAPRRFAEERFRAFALRDLRDELRVRKLERAVQLLQLARVLVAQLRVSGRELAIRRGENLVQARELAALLEELHEHLYLAAQNFRHDRDVNVIRRTHLVAAQAIEVGEVHARHEDDRRVAEYGALTNAPRRLEAVHPRHADVEQDRRELAFLEPRERFLARV